MKITKRIATPGMNAVKCAYCKTGTVFVSVSMAEMARMRCGAANSVIASCHNGHRQQITFVAWPPIQLERHYVRT